MRPTVRWVFVSLCAACGRGEVAPNGSVLIHADTAPTDSSAVIALAMQAYREVLRRDGDTTPGRANVLAYAAFPESTVVRLTPAIDSTINADGTMSLVLTSDGGVRVVVRGSDAEAWFVMD